MRPRMIYFFIFMNFSKWINCLIISKERSRLTSCQGGFCCKAVIEYKFHTSKTFSMLSSSSSYRMSAALDLFEESVIMVRRNWRVFRMRITLGESLRMLMRTWKRVGSECAFLYSPKPLQMESKSSSDPTMNCEVISYTYPVTTGWTGLMHPTMVWMPPCARFKYSIP